MTPHTTIEAARESIENFGGAPEDFSLPVSDDLNDSMGVAMAVLTDAALARGWEPAGFEQRNGYRVYRYAAME